MHPQKIVTFFTIIILAITSCSTYKEVTHVKQTSMLVNSDKSPMPSTDRIFGIKKQLEEADKINTEKGKYTRDVNVVLVHGMGTARVSGYDLFMDLLAASLNLKYSYGRIFTTGYNEECYTYKSYYNLQKCNDNPNIVIRCYTNGNTMLKFIFIHYSPATYDYKQAVKFADKNPVGTEKYSAAINENLELSLISDGLGDVAAIMKDEIKVKIFRAFEIANLLIDVSHTDLENLEDMNFSRRDHIKSLKSAKWKHDFISDEQKKRHLSTVKEIKGLTVDIDPSFNKSVTIISGSLGSKVTQAFYSAITDLYYSSKSLLPKDDMILYAIDPINIHNSIRLDYSSRFKNLPGFANSIRQRNYNWFMLSNQLALLQGSSINMNSILSDTTPYPSPVSSKTESATGVTTVNSFFDPNDLFGFRITESKIPYINADTIRNIMVPVQQKIPKIKALSLANPLAAHSGSKYNPYVISIIANGCIFEKGNENKLLIKDWEKYSTNPLSKHKTKAMSQHIRRYRYTSTYKVNSLTGGETYYRAIGGYRYTQDKDELSIFERTDFYW